MFLKSTFAGNARLAVFFVLFIFGSKPFTDQLHAQSVPVYTIPVVFHILHQGGPENISDAQVLDALNILNQDFQKQNPDAINIVPSYTNIAADVQFKFQLAGKDPNGNCTNGIIRHFTPHAVWDAADYSYFSYSWPSANYLNFYIVKNMTAPSGAYTFFPGSLIPAAADAIVALHNCCGSIGTSNPGNSRWITQKVGHWFNLQHTWGLSNVLPTSCGDDGVSDTPPTKGFFNCSLQNANLCNASIIENVQNFMDASPCPCMFTNGQKTRMHACINNATNGRNNLSSTTNLLATGITSSTNNCLPMLDINAVPNTSVCINTPLALNSYTSNASVTSYSWTANNSAIVSNATLANTSVILNSQGNCTVTCVATNSNGSVLANLVLYGLSNIANIALASSESFETATMPANWSVINPDTPTSYWSQNNLAASHGSSCMMVNGENAVGGAIEILQTPSYDFASNPGAKFTFRYAYARQSSTHNDVFKVQASKDCGVTWKDIYVPSAAVLAAGSGETTSSLFSPSLLEWKSYVVSTHPNFAPFLNESNVLIRFYFHEDAAGNGNRFYLDQVNLELATGVNELARSVHFDLYPNPVLSEALVTFELSDEKKVSYSVVDINGRTMLESQPILYQPGKHKILFNKSDGLNPGIYFFRLDLDGMKLVKKLVVE